MDGPPRCRPSSGRTHRSALLRHQRRFSPQSSENTRLSTRGPVKRALLSGGSLRGAEPHAHVVTTPGTRRRVEGAEPWRGRSSAPHVPDAPGSLLGTGDRTARDRERKHGRTQNEHGLGVTARHSQRGGPAGGTPGNAGRSEARAACRDRTRSGQTSHSCRAGPALCC